MESILFIYLVVDNACFCVQREYLDLVSKMLYTYLYEYVDCPGRGLLSGPTFVYGTSNNSTNNNNSARLKNRILDRSFCVHDH